MNRTPSPHPSPPVGERVPEGRVRGILRGSWSQCAVAEPWRLPTNLLPGLCKLASSILLVSVSTHAADRQMLAGHNASSTGTAAAHRSFGEHQSSKINDRAALAQSPRPHEPAPTALRPGERPVPSLGNNTTKDSPSLFYAVPGYDLCTGWGTPNGTNFINTLLSLPSNGLLISSPLGFTASGPVGGPFNFDVANLHANQ